MIYLKVTKPKVDYDVLLLKNKNDKTYSFVNITKGHICGCRFKSVKEALDDLEMQRELGNVLNYEYEELTLREITKGKYSNLKELDSFKKQNKALLSEIFNLRSFITLCIILIIVLIINTII